LGVAALIISAALLGLTPHQKAALVVVSGLPSPPGAGGVIVRRWDRKLPRPDGALVLTDQEGGSVQSFPGLPPRSAASTLRNLTDAYASGRETGLALRRAGVDVDLAPVLDLPDGPLGSRQFRAPLLGVTFARGLLAAGVGSCVKHFPGLGSLPVSTDERPYVRGRVRNADLAPYRAAIQANVPCVMVGHGVYPSLGRRRAALEPATYRLLRRLGFRGVAMTDSLDVVNGHSEEWALSASRAGADLLLFTSGADADRAIRALVPLARAGRLDAHVRRVLGFRAAFD
jgi:beta-N-acetylhexosaminidase